MGWLTFFGRWLRKARTSGMRFDAGLRQRPDLRVVVYTRNACPLCDKAWELLEHFQRQYCFVLESQNVDSSADLAQAYGDSVPVVTINGKVRFRGRVNPVLLRRMLEDKNPGGV